MALTNQPISELANYFQSGDWGLVTVLSDTIWQGLGLSVMGMGLTFAALGLLIVAMILLERLFRAERPVPDEREPAATPVVGTLEQDTEDEEIVAAISVALAYLRSLDTCRSGLGTALEAERSPWWTIGRLQGHPGGVPQTRGKGSQ